MIAKLPRERNSLENQIANVLSRIERINNALNRRDELTFVLHTGGTSICTLEAECIEELVPALTRISERLHKRLQEVEAQLADLEKYVSTQKSSNPLWKE